jgi:hypothetical protein
MTYLRRLWRRWKEERLARKIARFRDWDEFNSERGLW